MAGGGRRTGSRGTTERTPMTGSSGSATPKIRPLVLAAVRLGRPRRAAGSTRGVIIAFPGTHARDPERFDPAEAADAMLLPPLSAPVTPALAAGTSPAFIM